MRKIPIINLIWLLSNAKCYAVVTYYLENESLKNITEEGVGRQ